MGSFDDTAWYIDQIVVNIDKDTDVDFTRIWAVTYVSHFFVSGVWLFAMKILQLKVCHLLNLPNIY